jgi:hypothetical protein
MKYLPFLVLGLIFITCSRQDISPSPPSLPIVELPNEVYIAGFVDTPIPEGYRQTAAYWLNGQKFEMPGGLTSYTHSIAVAGNDVYVSGTMVDVDQRYKSVLWKNGERIDLKLPEDTDANSEVWISSMAALDSDFYACGYTGQRDGDGPALIPKINMLWKNDELIELNSNHPYATPLSISITGEDVYVNAGVGYWLNGVFIYVKPVGVYQSDDLINATGWIKSIKVTGGDIFFAGNINTPSGLWEGGYKKNDQDFVALPHPNFSQSEVVDMQVSGGDIYIIGKLFDIPGGETTSAVWKNSKLISVMSIGESEPLSMTIYKNQAFVTGITGKPRYYGVYWINTGVSWYDYKPIQVSECAAAQAIFVR